MLALKGHDDERVENDWKRTRWLGTLIANINRDRKKKTTPYKPEDLLPIDTYKKRKSGSSVRVNRDRDTMERLRKTHEENCKKLGLNPYGKATVK